MSDVATRLQTGFGHLADLPCVKLQYQSASAVVSLYGGQVLSFRDANGIERLWLSPKATWKQNSPIRGGIPVCWPWFGPASNAVNPNSLSLPSHGLVRNRMWQLLDQQVSENGCQVTLAIEVDDLPHHNALARLVLTVTLTHQLHIQLSCNSEIIQQAALHSYFKCADLASVLVHPLPGQYFDKVHNSHCEAKPVCTLAGETDRIYANTAAQLNLHSDYGSLSLYQAGHDASVIWNPGPEKSQSISDLAADSYQHFACVETACLSLSSHTLQLEQRIGVI